MYTKRTYDNLVAFAEMEYKLLKFLERDGLFVDTGRSLDYKDIYDAVDEGLGEIVVSVRTCMNPSEEEVASISGFVRALCEEYKGYAAFRNVGRSSLQGFKSVYFRWSLDGCRPSLPTAGEKVLRINAMLKGIGHGKRLSFAKGDSLVLESCGNDFDTDFPLNEDVSEVVHKLVSDYGFKIVSCKDNDRVLGGVVWVLVLQEDLVDDYRVAYGDEPEADDYSPL